jgi:hypothetical protein
MDPVNSTPETEAHTQTDPAEDDVVFTRGRTTVEGWSWSPLSIVLAVLLVASFGLWVYAYSGMAGRTPPDTFDDPAFARRAEGICADSMARYALLPNALSADDGRERAEQIRVANVILVDMIDRLEAEVTGTERDRGIALLWLDRWRILIADRADFADRIEADPMAVFYISREAGFRAEKSIDYIANNNAMPSCTLPADVG